MIELLDDYKDCLDNYVDDFIVSSDDMESLISDLRRVLSKLLATGWTLRGSNCYFGRSTVTHLGFEYTSGGVAPFYSKTELRTPQSRKSVWYCLGCQQVLLLLAIGGPGAHFTLETDHNFKPLLQLESTKYSHARSQRLEH